MSMLLFGARFYKKFCLVPHEHSQVISQPKILLSLALKNNWCTNELATCLIEAWSSKKNVSEQRVTQNQK